MTLGFKCKKRLNECKSAISSAMETNNLQNNLAMLNLHAYLYEKILDFHSKEIK